MKTLIKISLATGLFAVLHSLLASLAVKEAVARQVGDARRDGLYRLFYVVQALVSFTLLILYGLKQPRQVLYRLSGRLAWAARLGQLGGVAYAFYAAYHAGFWRMSGLANLWAWLSGRPLPGGPVAQGPERDAQGRLHIAGPFRLSRHPLNLSPLPAFWLAPVMTTRRLAFNLVGTLYLVLGSIHEEQRLLRVYGAEYRAYQRSRVPFYWPRW